MRASVRACVRASVHECVRACVRACVRGACEWCVRVVDACVRACLWCLPEWRNGLVFFIRTEIFSEGQYSQNISSYYILTIFLGFIGFTSFVTPTSTHNLATSQADLNTRHCGRTELKLNITVLFSLFFLYTFSSQTQRLIRITTTGLRWRDHTPIFNL